MIRLARKGRVFPRVEGIQYCNDDNDHDLRPLRDADLAAISPKTFPTLRTLLVWERLPQTTSLTSLPPIPNLTKFGVDLAEEKTDEVAHITADRFPNLNFLDLRFNDRLTALPPHPMHE